MDEIEKGKYPDGEASTFEDKVFECEINLAIEQTKQHYDKTNFRDALKVNYRCFDTTVATSNPFISLPSSLSKPQETTTVPALVIT